MTLVANKPCVLATADQETRLFARIRDMRDRLVSAAAQIHWCNTQALADGIAQIRPLLQQTDLSSAYKIERERSINAVAAAIRDHDDMKYRLLYWKDLSAGDKITTMAAAAVIQSRAQRIGGIEALKPRFRAICEARKPDIVTGKPVVVLGHHVREQHTKDGVTSTRNYITFNNHADAMALLQTPESALSTACHEQQHDMQDALAAALGAGIDFHEENPRVGQNIRRDARRFALSLSSIIPEFFHEAYLDQIHERDAHYVGKEIAKRTMKLVYAGVR